MLITLIYTPGKHERAAYHFPAILRAPLYASRIALGRYCLPLGMRLSRCPGGSTALLGQRRHALVAIAGHFKNAPIQFVPLDDYIEESSR